MPWATAHTWVWHKEKMQRKHTTGVEGAAAASAKNDNNKQIAIVPFIILVVMFKNNRTFKSGLQKLLDSSWIFCSNFEKSNDVLPIQLIARHSLLIGVEHAQYGIDVYYQLSLELGDRDKKDDG
jgi:hypothetical protein